MITMSRLALLTAAATLCLAAAPAAPPSDPLPPAVALSSVEGMS